VADVAGLVVKGREKVVFEGAQDDISGIFVVRSDEDDGLVVVVPLGEARGDVRLVGRVQGPGLTVGAGGLWRTRSLA